MLIGTGIIFLLAGCLLLARTMGRPGRHRG
jgi:hypothetical protein